MFLVQSTFWLSVLALLFIGLSILMSKIWPSTLFYSRKFLHITVISLLAYQVHLLDPKWNVAFALILLAIEFVLILLVFKGFFEIEGRKSWGIVYFLPPIVFLLVCFTHYNDLIALSIGILAFSDGLSAILGRYFQGLLYRNQSVSPFFIQFSRVNNIQWGQDQKTLIGFMVFTFTTMLILILNDVFNNSLIVFYMAVALASVELLSGKGSDNFFILLTAFFLLLFFQNRETEIIRFCDQYSFWLWVSIPLVFIVLRLKWLSISGVFFAVHLAVLVLLSGQSLWPLIAFFVVGTVAGKLNKQAITDSKHNKPRDAFQVLANGGMLFIFIFLSLFDVLNFNLNLWMLVSIAVASADTLSSEIGMKFGKSTVNILTLKPVEKGLSGGVSFAGFVGALIGASVVACFDTQHFYFIIFWGMMGSVIDSLLGMLFQAKYSLNGMLTDQKRGIVVKGYAFITNDSVNFWSNLIVVALAYCFL